MLDNFYTECALFSMGERMAEESQENGHQVEAQQSTNTASHGKE